MNDFLRKFKPIYDNSCGMLWGLCFNHPDKDRPNLSLTYDGKYRGRYCCWACGFTGRITEQSLLQIMNSCNCLSNKKIQSKYKNPFDVWATNRKYLFSCPAPEKTLGIVGAARPLILNALERLRAAYDGRSLLFPLRTASLAVVGVHRRPEKTHLKGSILGLFLPYDITATIHKDPTIIICEGVTDTIAAMLMGFTNVIGKPSALTGHKIILDFLKKYLPSLEESVILIVEDVDDVGRKGAKELQKCLHGIRINSRIITPEYGKDLKETYNNIGLNLTKGWLNEKIGDTKT